MREDDAVSPYKRSAVAARMFRDADGRVIEYGSRWVGSPPDDSYSVTAHPERYEPLHTVADALITHLRATYDVTVEEGPAVATDLSLTDLDIIRSVRVRPNNSRSASLTFAFTGYPGVTVHAGLLHDFVYPPCGCDACDTIWEGEADDLERLVFAVVAGGYRESITNGRRPWVEHALRYADGSSSGQSRAEDFPPERLAAARPVLRNLPEGWDAWPRAERKP